MDMQRHESRVCLENGADQLSWREGMSENQRTGMCGEGPGPGEGPEERRVAFS